MKHTLKNENGIKILCRDNNPLICPFKPNLVLPGQMAGQLTIHREPCGSHCPHFHIFHNEDNTQEVYISCGMAKDFKIDSTQQPTTPEPGKLIKL